MKARIRVFACVLGVLFFVQPFFVVLLHAQWQTSQQAPVDFGSLPADRFPVAEWRDFNWEDPGGWTVVDVTTAGITPGAADASPVLMNLANEADVPTVLYFPPGEYTFASAVDINNDNVIIRGAGSDQTFFYLDGSAINGIRFLGWTYDETNVVSNTAAGGQVLTLENTNDLAVGDLIQINQELETWDAEWGSRSWGQIVFITAINGNDVTVDLPLSLGIDTSQQPKVLKLRPLRNVGVEDLYIERKQYDESSNIEFRTVYNAFVKNVESYNAVKFHVFVYRGRQVEISGNYIHDAQNYGTGGHGYGVNLENLSTNILVTNNIFKNLRHHMLMQTGVNHSVISYNYNVDIKELVDLSLHGHFSNHNLYEGNIVWWVGFADFWGQVGPENTLFRSQIHGKKENDQGVIVYDNSDSQNIISNYFLRNSTLEKDADVDDLYAEGNVIQGATEWNTLSSGADIPPSLYLEAPPAFWPSDLAWPAFGHDVSTSATNKIPAQLRYENLIGIGPGDTNDKPEINLTSPASGTNFASGSSVTIEADASDPDGTITSVDFYVDGFWQGSDADAPYSFEWSNVLDGSYVLTAGATDNEGATTISSEVTVSVTTQDSEDVYITSVIASDSREGASPDNTLDGQFNTRWAAHGEGQWIQYSLSSSATVSSVELAWARGDTRVAYFDIAVSEDAADWTTVAENMESSGATTGLETYNITPVTARYVRIIGYGTSSNAWNMISEASLGFDTQITQAFGDVTGNGTVSASDASAILEYTVGYIELEGAAYIAGDVTGNGDLSALDAALVLQYVTGIITCFPAADASCTAGASEKDGRRDLFQAPGGTHRP
ncbi:MAG: Ig-like domain-containing protein [Bacteroidota bacterium]